MTKKLSGVYCLFLILGILFIIAGFFCAKNLTVYRQNEVEGQSVIKPAAVKNIDEDTKEYYFTEEQLGGINRSLTFYSVHSEVEVYEDGELIFQLKGINSIFGKSPGSKWNFIELSEGSKEVIVRVKALYPSVRNPQMVFYEGVGVEVLLKLMRESALSAGVSLLDLGIGIFLMMYFFIVNRKMHIGRHVLYFGMFAVFMGFWSLNETTMMALLVKNVVASSIWGYICLMLMIAPFAMFVQGFLFSSDKWMAQTISYVSIVNMAVCMILHMTNILEFRQSATSTHLLMAVDIAYLGYALKTYIHENGMNHLAKINIAGIVILFVSLAVDIMAFYFTTTKTDVIGRFGFLLYIGLLGWQAASDSLTQLHEGQKAAIYKELALKDILTGLYSRNAYDEWEKENQCPEHAGIVTFDLNNLKQCNDNMGHACGDVYLRKAAELIAEIFSEIGAVYRIGGDEFCVIVKNANSKDLEKHLEMLKLSEHTQNEMENSVPVEIACGYAIFDKKVDSSFADTRNRADANMYENKRMLKEKRA